MRAMYGNMNLVKDIKLPIIEDPKFGAGFSKKSTDYNIKKDISKLSVSELDANSFSTIFSGPRVRFWDKAR